MNAMEYLNYLIETAQQNFEFGVQASELMLLKALMTGVCVAKPEINAVFEVECAGVTGRTDAKIKRVDQQDDGSFTVVIDHWPR